MKRLGVLAAFAAILMTASAVHAEQMKFGAEVFGAFNTYSMEKVNDDLDAFNATGGASFDNITNGFTGGLGVRLWANPNWLLTAGWEPLFSETKSSVPDADGLGNPGEVRLNLNGNSVQAGAAYFFPPQGSARYGIGAGVGYYFLSGEYEEAVTGGASLTEKIKGNTVGFHFLGMGEWTVSPGFGITAAGGYRIAKVDKPEIGGVEDPDAEADYSGFMGRVGLSFYLPSGSSDY